MRNMIGRFMMNLKIEDINSFALSKGINLTDSELSFTYNFVKKNWESMLSNPQLFDIDRYQGNYNHDTFIKIKKVFNEYFQKYANYL